MGRAVETVEAVQEDLQRLEAELHEETARIQQDLDPDHLVLQEVSLRPKKTDITIGVVALLWIPWRSAPDGVTTPAYRKGQEHAD